MFGHEAKLAVIANREPPQVDNEIELLAALRVKLGPYASEPRLIRHIRSAHGKLHWSVNSYFREVLIGSQQGPGPSAAASHVQQEPQPRLDFLPPPPGSFRALRAEAQQPDHGAAVPEPQQGSSHSDQGACGDASQSGAGHNGRPCSTSACAAAGGNGTGGSSRRKEDAVQGRIQTFLVGSFSGGSAGAGAGTAGSAGSGSGLESLPCSLLEEVLARCSSAAGLAAAACTCRAFRKASESEALWAALFKARWGPHMFPLDHPTQHQPPAFSALRLGSGMAPMFTGIPSPSALSSPGSRFGPGQGSIAEAGEGDAWRGSGRLGPGPGTAAQGPVHSANLAQASGPAGPAQLGQSSSLTSISHVSPGGLYSGHGQGHRSHDRAAPSGGAGPQGSGSGGREAGQGAAGSLASEAQGPAVPRGSHAGQGAEEATDTGGVWRERYREQASYAADSRCPRCGTHGALVPLVYGFPSPHLLEGMRLRKLILGGDHLIEDCHCWACTSCNASYRTYPYEQPALWIADHEHERARRANSTSGSQGPGMQGGGPGGQGAPGQQQHVLPTYTYEL